MKKLLVSFAVAATLGLGASAAYAGTLDDVKAKGFVQCGVNTGLPGFGNPDSTGKYTGFDVDYPLIGDKDLAVAKLYDMLPAAAGDSSEGRTPADNATVRSVFVIGPDKKIKLILTYPMTTGRNFAEILRAIDSIQLTSKHQVATPANWQQGDDVIITAAVSNEDAIARFGSFDTVLPYLRKTRQPAA